MLSLSKLLLIEDDKNPLEMERLRATEKPVLPATIFFSVITILYIYLHNELKPAVSQMAIISATLVTGELLFQSYIVPSRYFGHILNNVETIFLSAFTVAAVSLSGGFASPFFFLLYVIIISTPINTSYAAIMHGISQIIFLCIATVLTPAMMASLSADPIRSVVLIFSPAVAMYFTSILLAETLTQKSQKKKALELSELLSLEKSRLETVMANIGDIIFACNTDGTIILVNDTVQRYGFFDKGGMIGKRFQDVFPGLDFESENKSMEKIFGSRETVTTCFSVMIRPLFDRKGSRTGKVVVFHDVSREHELEEMKLDFVSIAAHELRTPLTSIRGYLSFLMDDAAAFSGKQQDYLKRINISSQQLVVLINNLLSITRIERNAMVLNREITDWTAVVKNVTDQLGERASQKRIRLTLSLPDRPLPPVLADPIRIEEVLLNLIQNAINYTQAGGSVDIGFEAKNGFIVTHVTDTGQGIPKDALPRLFTMFFRVSGKLEQGSKGTGLGLYISKAIVEMHHGTIWVESEPGKGSTFSFSLPEAPQR